MKNNETPGPDGVRVEFLKILCQTNVDFLGDLVDLFNIYDSGQIPADCFTSTFITTPKRPRAAACD